MALGGLAVVVIALGLTILLRDDGDHEAMRRVKLPVAERGPGGRAGTLDATEPDQPLNILLIGSDERSPEEAAVDGVTGRRSDTIAIVRVDPRTNRLRLLSIPRDLWVTIADTNEPGKVNGAFGGGGPDRLIRTLRANLGLPIHRYVEVDFEGFRALVDLVGGVDLVFAGPTRDTNTGFEVDRAGTVHLDGGAALRYARSRHLAVQVDGSWRPDPTGDLGRIRRQQELLRALAAEVATSSRGDPGALDELLVAMGPHLTIDAAFPLVELLGLVKAYIDTDPDTVEMELLPTAPDRVEGQSVLRLDVPRAADVLSAFGAIEAPSVPQDAAPTTTTSVPPSTTTVTSSSSPITDTSAPKPPPTTTTTQAPPSTTTTTEPTTTTSLEDDGGTDSAPDGEDEP